MSFVVRNVPSDATQLQIYGWEGLRRTIPLNGEEEVTVSDLEGEQTHMFVAE